MKRVVGFGIYYALFGAAAYYFGVVRHWRLMIPMIVVILVIGYIAIDGPADRAADFKAAVRDPMVADELHPEEREGIPQRLSLLLAALPPVLYVVGDLFFGN